MCCWQIFFCLGLGKFVWRTSLSFFFFLFCAEECTNSASNYCHFIEFSSSFAQYHTGLHRESITMSHDVQSSFSVFKLSLRFSEKQPLIREQESFQRWAWCPRATYHNDFWLVVLSIYWRIKKNVKIWIISFKNPYILGFQQPESHM